VPTFFQANNAILHYFMVKIQNFLGWVVAFLLSGGRGQPVQTDRGSTALQTSKTMMSQNTQH
jgi:hypothetical protein